MSQTRRDFRRRCSHLIFVVFIATSVAVIAMAQNAVAQNDSASDDPMALPPRTSEPPASVQQSPASTSSPTSGKDDDGRFVFKKQVQEVVLHATVVDDAGHLVTSLDRNSFTVYQNSQRQTITSFRREDIPVAMGVVIDNSGSMRDKRAKVNQAVVNLIQISNPQDEVFVVNFGQIPYLDQDFTSNPSLLQAALRQVASRGSTALYDAVTASAIHLRHNPRLDKKVLLVVTDGQDNMSRETLQDTIQKLQSDKGPTLYAIGLTDQGMTQAAREDLQRLAASTGGVAFFPQNLDEVDEITRAIAHDIRSQYTLAYNPGNTAGKGYQQIRVEAKSAGYKRLVVRTRSGYYPGETLR